MKLLTHNMLSSNLHIQAASKGLPLVIEAVKVVVKEIEMNADFLRNIFPRIHWKVLSDAAASLGYSHLPGEAHPSMLRSHDFLSEFHHALMELHLQEGTLICPQTGRRFPVINGIPNLLLPEDEV